MVSNLSNMKWEHREMEAGRKLADELRDRADLNDLAQVGLRCLNLCAIWHFNHQPPDSVFRSASNPLKFCADEPAMRWPSALLADQRRCSRRSCYPNKTVLELRVTSLSSASEMLSQHYGCKVNPHQSMSTGRECHWKATDTDKVLLARFWDARQRPDVSYFSTKTVEVTSEHAAFVSAMHTEVVIVHQRSVKFLWHLIRSYAVQMHVVYPHNLWGLSSAWCI